MLEKRLRRTFALPILLWCLASNRRRLNSITDRSNHTEAVKDASHIVTAQPVTLCMVVVVGVVRRRVTKLGCC